MQLYIDSSKTADGIYAVILGPRTKLSVAMGNFPSIFQTEVYAISRCAEIILEKNYQ